ncbi:MAG: HAD family hydrolase [Proteobacteria bacterium]|nr:HAD family hydrolase [Pseudomonadota bacterium]
MLTNGSVTENGQGKLRALLFDKDGTLVDFNATWAPALEGVMRHFCGADEALFARLVAINRYDLAARRLMPDSPFIAEASPDFGLRWADCLGLEADEAFFQRLDALFNEGSLAHATPIGDPVSLLAALKGAGYQLGIVTNDTEASAMAQSHRLGFHTWFDRIIGYDSGYGHKPDPGQILAFADEFSLRPIEIAMIGDSRHDLDAARAAGVIAIGVASGFASAEALAPYADHVLPDIMHLPALLEQLG